LERYRAEPWAAKPVELDHLLGMLEFRSAFPLPTPSDLVIAVLQRRAGIRQQMSEALLSLT